MIYVVLAISLPDFQWKLCNLSSQSPRCVSCQPSSCFWFQTNIFLAMSFSMALGITRVRFFLSSTSTMASKRAGSKDTVESENGDAIEKLSMSLPIYEHTKLFIDKEIKMKWKDINDTFSSTFEENLEDCRVYFNIQKSGLYWIACTYLAFHARTWSTGLSRIVIQRKWCWDVLLEHVFLPSGWRNFRRCITCHVWRSRWIHP